MYCMQNAKVGQEKDKHSALLPISQDTGRDMGGNNVQPENCKVKSKHCEAVSLGLVA